MGTALLSAMPHEWVLAVWWGPGVVLNPAPICIWDPGIDTIHIWFFAFIALKKK